jgi:hypothetical protein
MIGREGPDPINQLLVSILLTLAIIAVILLGTWLLLK